MTSRILAEAFGDDRANRDLVSPRWLRLMTDEESVLKWALKWARSDRFEEAIESERKWNGGCSFDDQAAFATSPLTQALKGVGLKDFSRSRQ